MAISEILLWLFVVNLGIALGAGLYESRVVVPIWASAPPQSLRQPDVGLRFWVYVTTFPLTLLTLANLVAAFFATEPRRAWWLAAALIAVAERAMTFGYFIPTMIRLQNSNPSAPTEAAASLRRWDRLGYFRHALVLAAWLAALRALTMPA